VEPHYSVTTLTLNDEKENMQQQGLTAYMTKSIDETMLNLKLTGN